jgi:acyl-CoA hydrolase
MFEGETNRVGTLIETLLPKDTNSHGSIFGGIIMSIMDKAAGVAAWQYAKNPVVTAGVEGITFHTPIQVGEVVKAVATIVYTGRSSMDIEVLVEAADVIAGTQRLAASGIFTMVAVDAGGQTIPVPTFTPETEVDWEKYRQAETRRAARKQS